MDEKSYSLIFNAAAAALIFGAGYSAAYLSAPLWATDEVGATQALEKAGLTPKNVGGYALFKCDHDEFISYQTKFSAVNKNGETVEGAVCKRILSRREPYIRFNP